MRDNPPARSRATDVLPWATLALIALLGALAFQREMASPLAVPDSTRTTAAASSAPAPSSPVVVQFPDTMVMVVVTPTAEATAIPTATYTYPPTPMPILCGEWVAIGDVCQWPAPPNTPTPTMPDCPVAPMSECVWRGQTMGTPVTAPEVSIDGP